MWDEHVWLVTAYLDGEVLPIAVFTDKANAQAFINVQLNEEYYWDDATDSWQGCTGVERTWTLVPLIRRVAWGVRRIPWNPPIAEWQVEVNRSFPVFVPPKPLREPSCKVCGATPDENGERVHGRGCYQISEDGGGSDWP